MNEAILKLIDVKIIPRKLTELKRSCTSPVYASNLESSNVLDALQQQAAHTCRRSWRRGDGKAEPRLHNPSEDFFVLKHKLIPSGQAVNDSVWRAMMVDHRSTLYFVDSRTRLMMDLSTPWRRIRGIVAGGLGLLRRPVHPDGLTQRRHLSYAITCVQ
jgi:hypothetical protein